MHVLDSYGIMIKLQKDHGQRGKEGSIIGEYGNEGVLKRLSYSVHIIARRPSVPESIQRPVKSSECGGRPSC